MSPETVLQGKCSNERSSTVIHLFIFFPPAAFIIRLPCTVNHHFNEQPVFPVACANCSLFLQLVIVLMYMYVQGGRVIVVVVVAVVYVFG